MLLEFRIEDVITKTSIMLPQNFTRTCRWVWKILETILSYKSYNFHFCTVHF